MTPFYTTPLSRGGLPIYLGSVKSVYSWGKKVQEPPIQTPHVDYPSKTLHSIVQLIGPGSFGGCTFQQRLKKDEAALDDYALQTAGEEDESKTPESAKQEEKPPEAINDAMISAEDRNVRHVGPI